jgi:hypothetical protein
MIDSGAIASANNRALARIRAARPVLLEPVLAREATGLSEGELGHAGPPFAGLPPPPVVLNSLAGAAVHEGWAGDVVQARRMVLDGVIRLRPNHSLGSVSPMAGVVRPGQRLFRIVDRNSGAETFATLAEKGRQILRFGYYDEAVGTALRFLENDVAEAIAQALPNSGLDILPILAKGVELGDDVHQRNIGGMLTFLSLLPDLPAPAHSWLAGNPQHFLNYAMAAAKLCLDQARGVAHSTVVTAISRNGLVCGVQLAGTGDAWFTAPVDAPNGRFFEPFTRTDAHADLGDSAIMEAYGLGGCIAHASPEIARTMGRDWSEAVAAGRRMRRLFIDANPMIAPALAGEAKAGIGLDASRIADSTSGVRIHTGIAHGDGKTGWIGVGVAEAPLSCFANAVDGVVSQATSRDQDGRASLVKT